MNKMEKEREFEYSREDFNFLRSLSNNYSGIIANDDKFDMFYSRLAKRLRVLQFKTFKQYCQYLENNHEQEFSEFINAITTNLTAFFREKHHFDYLKKVLIPELIVKKQTNKQIKVWSAGCSTGEEAYSLAITLLENLPQDFQIKILATDLDTQVLNVAKNGEYPLERSSGLSEEMLKKWFKKGIGKNQGKIKAKSELQHVIRFKQLNLMHEWPMTGPFDFIFCRNVLIYFDRDTKQKLIQRYQSLLPIGTRLFIGHSESLHQLDTGFDLIGNTIYQRNR
ncbi:CheR family methyltransferase [methane-oxidizing endosymbiont of Gigantopelta aegis]|uniref:CheR family methyltransferase n=1 Tax=methane-oxidizing endosymbiont of Gigantopelta aegis TaxID=2794938 RepID=UPI0018DB8DA0|nr:protein-glutamate O-methyltransferase CheR [methane-oxidizing endosymbiont of Gigantopelta aegis]